MSDDNMPDEMPCGICGETTTNITRFKDGSLHATCYACQDERMGKKDCYQIDLAKRRSYMRKTGAAYAGHTRLKYPKKKKGKEAADD